VRSEERKGYVEAKSSPKVLGTTWSGSRTKQEELWGGVVAVGRPLSMPQESSWRPQEAGVHQICYLLAQVQKPGTDQGQVHVNLDLT